MKKTKVNLTEQEKVRMIIRRLMDKHTEPEKSIPIDTLAAKAGVCYGTIRKHVRDMVLEGDLIVAAPGRGGYFRVTDPELRKKVERSMRSRGFKVIQRAAALSRKEPCKAFKLAKEEYAEKVEGK